MHCLYFPSISNVLFFIFIYAFSTFRTRNRKKRDRQALRRRWHIVARVFVAEFFREGIFESGKVIFALHDTKWLSYVQNQYLSHQQHLYIMCISYFYISKYQWCIFYILYAIWFLNIDTHSHSKWKPTFCFDCKWIDRVVSKCCSNITQYFFLTNHIVVFFPHTIKVSVFAYLWLVLLFRWELSLFTSIFYLLRLRVWKSYIWRKSVEQWKVKKFKKKNEGRRNIKHILLRFKYCNLLLCDGLGSN